MYFGFYRLLISHVFLERHLKKLQHGFDMSQILKAKSDKKEWGNGELRG